MTSARPSMAELCCRYKNEDVHTAHVTWLGLTIFDCAAAKGVVSVADRALLEAACRLHDVGYSEEGRRHARASAQIIADEGVRGFSNEESRTIAAAVLLHQRRYRRELDSPLLGALPEDSRGRALQIASFLRIADALDHSHLQDLAIETTECRENELHVSTTTQVYEGNVAFARLKADLWHEAMPCGVTFTNHHRPPGQSDFAGVVRAGDDAYETLRRIGYHLVRTIVDCRQGALAGDGPSCLHDIRVSARRWRAALRSLRKSTDETSVRAVDRAVKLWSGPLGCVRDHDVWIAFLEKQAREEHGTEAPVWADFLQAERERRVELNEVLVEALKGEAYGAVMASTMYLLRCELTRPAEGSRPVGGQVLAGRLKRGLRRLRRRAAELGWPDKKQDLSAGDMHDLRRFCRKQRYLAEFMEPVLGEVGSELVRRLRDMTHELGELHDMDVAPEHIKASRATAPHELETTVAAARKKHLRRAAAAWRTLNEKTFRRDLKHVLKGMLKAPVET